MKVDQKELAAVSQSGPQAPRMEMYAPIHKALRAAMCDALLALGKVDTQDEADLARCATRLGDLLQFCRNHLSHENEFAHTAMERRAAGSSLTIAADHVEHVRHLDALEAAMSRLLAADAAQRDPLALALYRELSLFVGENFHHMHVEETAHNDVLWANYTDEELKLMHDELLASIGPEEMMGVLRWMVPALNPGERLHMLAEMRASAPAPAFAAALDVVRPHLSNTDWAKLARGLGLPVSPGLAA